MKNLIYLTLLILLIFGCNEQSLDDYSNKFEDQNLQNETHVSLAEALLIAETIEHYDISKNLGSQKKNQNKTIKDYLIVPSRINNNTNSFFIINYNEGGFLIISGNKNTEPILAFSDSNYFDFKTKSLPNGILDWIESTSTYISNLNNTDNNTLNRLDRWDNCEIEYSLNISSGNRIDECSPGDCENKTTIVGPFIETKWGQGKPYNNLLDNGNCGLS